MSTNQNEKALWSAYFKKALSRPHNPLTEKALLLNQSGLKSAIDCGCGTGADLHYMLEQGYHVYGFDQQHEAIELCRQRFDCNPSINLEVNSFEDYDYPKVGIITAHNSLFFAKREKFKQTWQNITNAMTKGGVFAGSFIGYEDSWVIHSPERFCPVTEEELMSMFSAFEIIQCEEQKYIGDTVLQKQKHWHVFRVLAIKL